MDLDAKNAVETILLGSEEINRMKREIKIVMDALLGLIGPGERIGRFGYGNGNQLHVPCADQNGQWGLNFDSVDKFTFYQIDLRPFARDRSSKLLYSTSKGVKLEDVEIVYDALLDLVHGMLRDCRQVHDRIWPYERAAKRARERK